MSAPAPETAVTSPAILRKVVAASMIGTTIEWYDFFLYGTAAALVFNKLFFPESEPLVGTMLAFATYAVGFVARPLGGVVFGHFGDRIGRKKLLMLSLIIMGVATVLIGCLPTHGQVGVLAPILLVVLRIVQGFAVGGEWGGAVLIVAEHGDAARRGFWASFPQAGVAAGSLLASGILALMAGLQTEADFLAWGWRVPFVIGAILAVVAFFLRGAMEESKSFVEAKASGVELGSTKMLFKQYPRETLTVLGLTAGGSLTFYIYTTYMQKFLANTAGFTRDQATELSAATLFCFMLIQPLIGWISDKVGRKPMLLMAFGGGTLITYPVMTTVAQGGSMLMIFFILIGAMIVQGGYTAINAVVKAELYPSYVRTLGVALPYALANATFGGTAEYVALWFKSIGLEHGFYIYASAIMAFGFLVVLTMPDTRKHSRIQED